jgi:alpha-mannosidase
MRSKILFLLTGLLLELMPFSCEIKGQISGAYKEEKKSIPGTNPMYMLTYDHGGLVLWGTDHFAKYLHSAINWLNNYPGFKIGLDNEAYTYDYLKLRDTALLGELRSYLKRYKGRFGIGTCTYGQPLSQFINEESNIRQIGYALETDQSVFQYIPAVYLMSEHAMHSQIPQILNGFGFKGAIMRTHFMMYGYNPTFDSPIGWWIGRDGSRIPTIPTYKGEGSGFGWVTEDNLILTRYPGPECDEPLEAFRQKFSHISPLLATRADDSGLRQEGLVKEYEGKSGFKWLLLDEIFPNFPSPQDEYNTMPDDFHVRMPWGYCGNEIWNMSRTAEVKILTAERIAAMELLLGGKNHENKLHESWKNLLVAQHHDIQICGILEDSRRFLPASIGISDSVIQSSMNFISSQMQGGNLGQITIFNPLSWTRKELLEVSVSLPERVKNFEVRNGDKPVPFEILSSIRVPDKNLAQINILIPVEVPALTFQSLSIVKSTQQQKIPQAIEFDRQNLRITTPYWNISLNKEGGISEITNRKTGRQMLKGSRNCYFAGVINGQSIESEGHWNADSITLTNNQLILNEDGKIGSIPYRLEMTINSFSSGIDYKVKFQFNNEEIGRVSENKREVASAFLHEEKLRFKIFPALGIGTTGIRDLPFTISETDDNYIEGNYWTALADGHSGIAIFNRGNMGSVHESDGSFSIPLAYSMYYVWKTVMLKGEFTYEFCLYPFEGKWEEADLHRNALDYTFPCVATISKKGNGKSGNQIQLFNVSSSDVILSALYTQNDKPLFRFYESQGTNGKLKLDYLYGVGNLTEVDFGGKEKGKVESTLLFKPWQIRTLRISIPEKGK